MMRGLRACAFVAIAAASAVPGAGPLSARATGAPAQAPAAVLRDLPNDAAFGAAFDGAAAAPRLVLLLSPT